MTKIVLPNVRKCFIPDPDFAMYEADLKGADAQVVAWEMEDEDLKSAFRRGIDIHSHNAEAMWGLAFTSLPEGSHARDFKRQECKHTIHGIHYGCSPRTTAIQRGWTVHEAERFHSRWLSLHPGVRLYHDRVRASLERGRFVSNRFGFRREFFDRIDQCFTEALAWIPQSTVALNTFLGALQLERRFWPHQLERNWTPVTQSDLEGMLLQTHDSINFQFRTQNEPLVHEIKEALQVQIPYDDILVIPWELKRSTRSWGDMTKCA